MRIASNTVAENFIRQIQQLSNQQTKLQGQVSTGRRIAQPEDDPAAIGRVLNLQSQQQTLDQFARNATRALDLSQASFSGLSQIKKLSDRATEIGTLGTGAVSAEARAAYASELNQLIEQGVQLANSRLGNDYLYAGTAVDQPPFVATRDAQGRITGVAYAGNAQAAPIPLSDTTSLNPATSGATNAGLRDFVNHLVSLRDALEANDGAAVSTARTSLIASEDLLVSALAEHGAVQMRIETNRAQQAALAENLAGLIAAETEADLPATVVKLNQAQTAYQAALQSAATIMRTSLLDYLN
ncbi:MAG: flagellin [Opitutaceae bacterium]|nr:flagellin [Opitutaceae bacterium]